MIVVACNTASSLAIDYLQRKFSLPIIGVIDPGVQLAISKTKSKSIGVMPIFHPEYLMVNPNMKKRVWDDIKYLKQ